jgi:hypothetical protein
MGTVLGFQLRNVRAASVLIQLTNPYRALATARVPGPPALAGLAAVCPSGRVGPSYWDDIQGLSFQKEAFFSLRPSFSWQKWRSKT